MRDIDRICKAVAHDQSVTVTFMMQPRQTKTRVKCRQLAMALTRELTSLSWGEISEQFQVHHATAIRGVNRVKQSADYARLKTILE